MDSMIEVMIHPAVQGADVASMIRIPGGAMRQRQPSRRKPSVPRSSAGRRAFTLLEALVASVILGASVIAVVSAMSTAQKLAFEGQKRVLGAMAANDLLIELSTLDYSVLRAHAPINHTMGQMLTTDGAKYPESFWAVGRSATFEETKFRDSKSDAIIRGVKVLVTCRDEDKSLCTIEAFFTEPGAGGGT